MRIWFAVLAIALTAATVPEKKSTVDEHVLVGAGDIGSCASKGDEATAMVLDRTPGTVFTLGDNAYVDGSADHFRRCYDPTWGRHRERTRPAIGNHDVRTDNGQPYYDYFGPNAGTPGEGWYSYREGEWLVVVLNSNCDMVGCEEYSRQGLWLARQLSTSPKCTIAMWHHPPFASGKKHEPERAVRPLFKILYQYGVEVLLSGHNHNYERMSPVAPNGQIDFERGVRPFVVGTGGGGLNGFRHKIAEYSEVRDAETHGVLKLTLSPDKYEWKFLGIPGSDFSDSGSDSCH